MSETLKILNTLTQTISISGDEKNVGKCMAQYLEPYCDEIVYDNLGSVFGVKKSKKENAKRVLVITHMDESGLMITKINDNGSAEQRSLRRKAAFLRKYYLNRARIQYGGTELPFLPDHRRPRPKYGSGWWRSSKY